MRAANEGVSLDEEVMRTKAEGLAFSLRNASDYFKTRAGQNVSQRVLNLYYGSMAFAFAEMLAAPKGPAGLADIEKITTQGHGSARSTGSWTASSVVVSTVATGFFASWMKFLSIPTDSFRARSRRPTRTLRSSLESSWLTVEALFARIPEVADLFLDIFSSKPAWITPTYDQEANPSLYRVGGRKGRPTTTYSIFVDDSARLTTEDIAAFPGPISQILRRGLRGPGPPLPRVAVNAAGKEIWWDALPVHNSPFERTALIVPAFGVVGEYRAICAALLYALSIMVRYRPSVWRRVQEGDHDHLRVLVEAYLAVVDRVLPEQFLERITAQRVFAKQPGAWG
ncbi:MAG: hypothetical protein IPI49_28055 [Myxococcales bacterium]|nr:hypothetical protein [Myxococcales bacterium]